MPLVTGIKEGSIESSTQIGGELPVPQASGSRTYFVVGDNMNTTEKQIKETTGIPQMWSKLGEGLVGSITARAIQTVKHPNTQVPAELYEVTVSYGDSDTTPPENTPPTALPRREQWYGETVEEVMPRDAQNRLTRTAADENLKIQFPRNIIVLEIKRYEKYPFDASVAYNYLNKINAQEFRGAPIGSALISSIRANEHEIKNIKYNEVTYVIKFKYDPDMGDFSWDIQVLHEGWMFREVAGAPPKRFQDKEGNPKKINLQIDGTQLPDGSDPWTLQFSPYASADFRLLNIG